MCITPFTQGDKWIGAVSAVKARAPVLGGNVSVHQTVLSHQALDTDYPATIIVRYLGRYVLVSGGLQVHAISSLTLSTNK